MRYSKVLRVGFGFDLPFRKDAERFNTRPKVVIELEHMDLGCFKDYTVVLMAALLILSVIRNP